MEEGTKTTAEMIKGYKKGHIELYLKRVSPYIRDLIEQEKERGLECLRTIYENHNKMYADRTFPCCCSACLAYYEISQEGEEDYICFLELNRKSDYEEAIIQLVTKCTKMYRSRIAERGDDYQSVWKEMTLDEHAALIMVKARRLKHAITHGLTDEIEENQVDLLNYVFFTRAVEDKEDE